MSGAAPGRAAYERYHAFLRQRFPGIAPIGWDEHDKEAQAEWEDIARAGAGPLIEEAVAAERKRIRDMADRCQAACTGDEGTSFYFSALLEDGASPGTDPGGGR